MLRLSFITLLSVIAYGVTHAQQHSMSLGLYTGLTIPYTYDEGIDKDSRYRTRYDVKFAPIGLNYGMDYEGFGFVISPGLIELGQDFYVTNTLGGEEGLRKIDLQYLNVPFAFKLHIINLSFFRVSAVASISGAFLLDGEESISHNDAKLKFPTEVYPILPETYDIEYDGVISPTVDNYIMLKKDDFQTMQFFGAAGFRADWDVSNNWRVSFDFRVNYGILDPRKDAYLKRLEAHETLYDMPGKRKDMFAQLSIGISRYIEFDKSDKDRQKKLKGGGSKRYVPKNAPKRAKPKG